MDTLIITNVIASLLILFFTITPTILLVVLMSKQQKPANQSAIKELKEMDETLAIDTNNALEVLVGQIGELNESVIAMNERVTEIEEARSEVKGFNK